MQVTVTQFSTPTVSGLLLDDYGDPVDLTGKTLKFAAKRVETDPDAQKILDVTATNDPDQTNNTGKFTLAIPFGATSITPGTYPASLRVWNASPTTDPPDRVEPSAFEVKAALIATET
jgi:hypothetical protein